MSEFIIQTDRLGLRNWIESDIAHYAQMCQDPDVMKFFPQTFSAEEATKHVRAFQQHFAEHGFTYFAAELQSSGEFLGFVGLKNQTFVSPYTPCVDVGWRLRKQAWGNGYATEAARACLAFAFEELKLEQVIAMCPVANVASEAVMKRLGMEKVGEFDHPAMPADSPLNPCVAYRASDGPGD